LSRLNCTSPLFLLARLLSYWDWESDDIAVYTYPYRFNSRDQASEYAHESERLCSLLGDAAVFFLPVGIEASGPRFSITS
jgi:hypothetical protein